MTLTDLKKRLSKYWIFLFFGGFFIIFILLYLVLNPSKEPEPAPVPTTLVPQESRPGSDPFANKPQNYQITDAVRSFSSPIQTTDITVSALPSDHLKIASIFNFVPTGFKELSTDLGPRKVFIDQNRTLAIDNLSLAYRNPQNQTEIVDIETIKSAALKTLQSVSPDPSLTLSDPEFHLSAKQTDQPVSSLAEADVVTFKILKSINGLLIASDRTPDLSVGSMTFNRAGTITSFNLITADFVTKNAINIISTANAIEKLTDNQSTIIQIKKLTGTKTDEEAYQIANFKDINIDSIQVAYFFPTTRNPESIYPFYFFSGTATSNDGQKYHLLLSVEAVIKTQ